MRKKKSPKQPPPTPTARAIGPCPTLAKLVGRPGTASLPSAIAPPDHRFCIGSQGPSRLAFSIPGRSPGRAVVLPPALVLAEASALAKNLMLKFFM